MKSFKLKYYAHAGETAQLDGKLGIICGWDDQDSDNSLIMAVIEGKGWKVPTIRTEGMHIVTHQENDKGYYFVKLKDIVK